MPIKIVESITIDENSPIMKGFELPGTKGPAAIKIILKPIVEDLEIRTINFSKNFTKMAAATSGMILVLERHAQANTDVSMNTVIKYLTQWYEFYTAFLDQILFLQYGYVIRPYHVKESSGFIRERTKKNLLGNENDGDHQLSIRSVDGYNELAAYYNVQNY